jgi:peptide-methionine (R)-S-oxide reductase
MKQINPKLSDDQKKVLFEKGTEAPGSGKYLHMNDAGQFTCANCDSHQLTIKPRHLDMA